MINNLPLSEFKFSIDVVGDETGQKFAGSFTYKIPTILEQDDQKLWFRRVTKDRQEALEDPDSMALYSILASVRTACSSCPAWWKKADYGIKLCDLNVVAEVFRLKRAAEEEWRSQIQKEASEVEINVTETETPETENEETK